MADGQKSVPFFFDGGEFDDIHQTAQVQATQSCFNEIVGQFQANKSDLTAKNLKDLSVAANDCTRARVNNFKDKVTPVSDDEIAKQLETPLTAAAWFQNNEIVLYFNHPANIPRLQEYFAPRGIKTEPITDPKELGGRAAALKLNW